MKDRQNPNHAKVLAALCDPRYLWRTVGGVSRDSGLPYRVCLRAMIELIEQNDICIGRNPTLFAARDHLAKARTIREIWRRLHRTLARKPYANA